MMRLNMGFMARVWGQAQVFTLPATDGHYGDDGRWVPGSPPENIEATATILPLTSYDLQHYEGGTYTTQDVKVVVQGTTDLPINTQFNFSGATFEVREERDYEAVADLRRYVAKRLREGEPP